MVTDRDVYISEEIKKRDAEIARLRVDLAARDVEVARLREALRPFADALKGNWSMQPVSMKIIAGPWASDLRIELTLAHFRNASYALESAALKGEHGKCHPVQFSDQIVCGKCGLTWDVNDPAPPKCGEGL